MTLHPRTDALPWWATAVLLPVINVTIALVLSGLVVVAIGENPFEALGIMLQGAFGYAEGLGYTLYYTTNLIFTGLCFALAYQCGLFNIGGEGQAYIGGLGVGLACLWLGPTPWYAALPLVIVAAGLFGGFWAFIPGYLQAKRGSHTVITTIMFNFIAASLMAYLMVNVLIAPGQMAPQSETFHPTIWLPFMHDVVAWFGFAIPRSPLNLSFIWALICCLLVWLFVWHSRAGYEVRTVGQNEDAARYAGIRPARSIVIAMTLAGALAGFVGLNEIMGVQHRLLLNFHLGYGFTGIAVALMGRCHPAGIIPAAFLFGILYQGGAELAFEMPSVSRELVIVVQGLVILFAGALEYMARPWLARLVRLGRLATGTSTAGSGGGGT